MEQQVRLEVMKSGKKTFEETTRIALNVDSALLGVGVFLLIPSLVFESKVMVQQLWTLER